MGELANEALMAQSSELEPAWGSIKYEFDGRNESQIA
jgi:hypothetical protein